MEICYDWSGIEQQFGEMGETPSEEICFEC